MIVRAAMADAILPPANFTGTATSMTSITLNWETATGATSYEIFRNNNSIATTSALTLVDTGLLANTLYTYAIQSIDSAGTHSANAQIAVATLKAPVTPPVNNAWTIKIDNGHLGKLINIKSNQKIKVGVYSSNASSTLPDLNKISFGGALPTEIRMGKYNKDNVADFTFEFRAQDMRAIFEADTKAIFEMTLRNGEVVKKEFTTKVKNSPKREVLKKLVKKFIGKGEKKDRD